MGADLLAWVRVRPDDADDRKLSRRSRVCTGSRLSLVSQILFDRRLITEPTHEALGLPRQLLEARVFRVELSFLRLDIPEFVRFRCDVFGRRPEIVVQLLHRAPLCRLHC